MRNRWLQDYIGTSSEQSVRRPSRSVIKTCEDGCVYRKPQNDMNVVARAWAKGRTPEKKPEELRTAKILQPRHLGGDATVRFLWSAKDARSPLDRICELVQRKLLRKRIDAQGLWASSPNCRQRRRFPRRKGGCWRLFVAQKSQVEILIVVMETASRVPNCVAADPLFRIAPKPWPRFGGAFSSRASHGCCHLPRLRGRPRLRRKGAAPRQPDDCA
jgi:hypothetical protein